METIRPLKLGALSLPDNDGRIMCRSILLDMLGEATITVHDGDLAGLTGLFWRYVSLSLATIYLPKTSLTLTAKGVTDASLVILRSMDGSLELKYRRRKIRVGCGDVIFIPADGPTDIVLPEGGRLDFAHLPAYALAGKRDLLKPVMLKPIEAGCLPLQLLTNYAGYLLRQEYHSEQDAGMMVGHFYDLLPVLAQHMGDSSAPSTPQARIDSIKSRIEDHLADGSYSVSDAAEAEGITPRAVQKFFSREGTTFSRYLLERRLAVAKTMIIAEGATRPISQVAYLVGFNDLSYFNRTFRQRYGMKPSDWRKVAAGRDE